MEAMEAHVGRIETQLKQWGAKLDELVAKADEAGAEAKADYRGRVDDLKTKQLALRAKLDELKTAGSEKWDTFKTDIDSAWSDFEVAFKKLTH